jgi:hypothetical protein
MRKVLFASALLALTATSALAADTVVDLAVGSKDHSTLVSAVTAAGLADTLKGAGPFTVFAPTNAAFEGLPAGTVDTLLKPESKDQLTKILTCHVVPASALAADVGKMITDGGGTAKIKTVGGCGDRRRSQGIEWRDPRYRQGAHAEVVTRKGRASKPALQLSANRRYAAFFSNPRLIRHSAICTALRAAPFRKLSETTHRLMPFSIVASSRIREMNVA